MRVAATKRLLHVYMFTCLTSLQNQPSYFKSRQLRDLSDFPILVRYILDIYCKAKFCCHKCFFSFFGTINLSANGDLIVTERIRFDGGPGGWGVESPSSLCRTSQFHSNFRPGIELLRLYFNFVHNFILFINYFYITVINAVKEISLRGAFVTPVFQFRSRFHYLFVYNCDNCR